MRKVETAHRALEQLLELMTLDVYAGRRTLPQAQAFSSAYDTIFRELEHSSRPVNSFGKAARFFFRLFPHKSRRIISCQFPFGLLTIIVQFDDPTNQCTIESIELV